MVYTISPNLESILSDEELETLEMKAKGLSHKVIAEMVGKTKRGIDRRVERIREKGEKNGYVLAHVLVKKVEG